MPEKLCFVVGPIGKEGSDERKHSDLLLNATLKPVIEKNEFGYRVKRADQDPDPGMINDAVVRDVINADLVVADLTDLNPNAFYELGIRHSTEKPTILIAKSGTSLPFDNASHRTIFLDLRDWDSQELARTRLAESLRAIGQPGFRVTNPITQANASFRMLNSGDPNERVIAQLNERLQRVESSIGRQVSSNLVETLMWHYEMDGALRALKGIGAPIEQRIEALKRIAKIHDLRITEGPGRLEFAKNGSSASFGLEGENFK